MIIAPFDTKSTTLLIVLGVTVMFLAAIHLLIGLINLMNQDLLIRFVNPISYANPNNYLYFMPFLFMIGLSYLILGIRLHKLKTKILASHIIISISLIIWTICWVFYEDKGMDTGTGSIDSAETMSRSTSMIIILIMVLIPQIIIGNKLYKLEKGDKTA